jgi:hypothetical protein
LMSALETLLLIPSALIFVMAWPGCAASGEPASTGTPTTEQMNELWIDVAGAPRDLRAGPAPGSPPPEENGRYDVVAIDTAGYSVTYRVKDRAGRDWNVKAGSEARPEVVSSRLLWALGYHQPPSYYVDHWVAVDTVRHLDAPRDGARFRPRDDGLEAEGVWSWRSSPFAGTRPYNGLLVLMMLLNSTDLKDDNNEIVRVENGVREGAARWYIVKDLGATLGETGVMDPRRGYLEGFEREAFIRGVEDGWVRFAYRGWHRGIVSRLTVADVKWLCARVLKLTDDQWRDAFAAAHYTDGETRRFVARLKQKAAEGMALP